MGLNENEDVSDGGIMCKVVKLERHQEDVFLLELKPSRRIEFKAGQFAMIHANGSEKPFSIASPPSTENLQFFIKEHCNGVVTSYLCNLKKGDNLKISGPYGAFCIRESDAKELVFIAVGTGIAPFRSMISDYLEKNAKKKIRLLYGFRNENCFEKEFRELEKKYKNFKAIYSCSNPTKNWKGLKGRLTEHLAEVIGKADGKEVYLCGMKEMVEDTKKILTMELGFDKKKVRVEEW